MEERTETHAAYCSACDRQVQVMVRHAEGGGDGEIVCLAYGESCTGAFCPLCDEPVDEMRDRLGRSEPVAESGDAEVEGGPRAAG